MRTKQTNSENVTITSEIYNYRRVKLSSIKFQFVKKSVDEEFDNFYQQLSESTNDKKKLAQLRDELKNYFYWKIYSKITTNPWLMKNLSIVNNKRNKKDDQINNLILSGAIKNIKASIKEEFFVLHLLISFPSRTIEELKAELRHFENFSISNKNEQELFRLVWEEEKKLSPLSHFKPQPVFEVINEKYQLVPPNEISQNKFTSSNFYGRYKKFRKRMQKKK